MSDPVLNIAFGPNEVRALTVAIGQEIEEQYALFFDLYAAVGDLLAGDETAPARVRAAHVALAERFAALDAVAEGGT